jgi:hypothetical protein
LSATASMRSIEPTEVPPNFCTSSAIVYDIKIERGL